MMLHTLNKNCDALIGRLQAVINDDNHMVLLIESGTAASKNPLLQQLACKKYILKEHASASELATARLVSIDAITFSGWLALSETASTTLSWY